MPTVRPDARGLLRCNSCRKKKQTADFHRSKLRACGFDSRCKSCTAKRSKIYQRQPANRARANELRKKHRARDTATVKRWRREGNGRVMVLLRCARERARKKGLPFLLKPEHIVIPERCPLLDVPLSMGLGKLHANSPSLDRKDPSKGYVPSNVWVISYRANAIKHDATLSELSLLVSRLACHLG
jgi:hypothetical protein